MTCFAVIGAGTIGAVHARNVAAHPGFTGAGRLRLSGVQGGQPGLDGAHDGRQLRCAHRLAVG